MNIQDDLGYEDFKNELVEILKKTDLAFKDEDSRLILSCCLEIVSNIAIEMNSDEYFEIIIKTLRGSYSVKKEICENFNNKLMKHV